MSLRILKELRHRYRQFSYEPDNPIDEDNWQFFQRLHSPDGLIKFMIIARK